MGRQLIRTDRAPGSSLYSQGVRVGVVGGEDVVVRRPVRVGRRVEDAGVAAWAGTAMATGAAIAAVATTPRRSLRMVCLSLVFR